MRFTKTLAALGAAAMLSTAPAMANGIVQLTFEGLQDNEPVANFYNGGLGGNGSGPGANLGIVFGSEALALIDADAGGSGNFGGEPSPDTALYFLTGSAVMNILGGFTTGFSFFYTAINQPGVITVWDGAGATGNILATLNIPTTPSNGAPDPTGNFSPFFPIGVAFAGTAFSVDFGGTGNQIAFDNITFGTDNPEIEVPAPAALGLFGMGLLGLGLARRRRA